MTRFARATGSKSSNARVAEEATSWNEFQRQLEQKRIDDSTSKPDSGVQDTLKRFKQGKPSEKTDWADFGTPTVQTGLSKHISNKRNASDTHGDGEEFIKSKKTKKLREEAKSNTSIISEEKEASGKKKMKKVKEEVKSNTSLFSEEGGKKKRKLKKQEEREENSVSNEAKVNNCESSEDCNTRVKKGKQMKANKERNQPSVYPQSSDPGIDKNAVQFRRRKPYVESSTISLNGITIHVSKFDGYDVKSEDALRLKDLRSKMLKEGIPRIEVDQAMKFERRKAEKALSRDKKKVCFNCRKAGHLLSECPEIGTFGSKSFDTGAVNLCYKCGSLEHTHYQCQVKKKKEYSFATCFICKEQGHISSQCPDNPRGLYPQGGCCKMCGEVTHLKKDCPQLSKERSENTVTLDTLASSNTVEGMGDDEGVLKKEKKTFVKQRKIIKF